MDSIVHPSQFDERNELLQACLRDQSHIPIEKEYPTVLHPNHSRYSYCWQHNTETIAHANLWPRILVDNQGQTVFKVGLIGNVATKQSWQGKGIMKKMLHHLHEVATNEQMSALLLWSDLDQFYHRLGFESFGVEWRLTMRYLPAMAHGYFRLQKGSDLNDEDLARMEQLRPNIPLTIYRERQEFKQLLTIPNTYIFTKRDDSKSIQAYLICGKGYDLNGVVHEWGTEDPVDLLFGIADLQATLGYIQTIILIPDTQVKSRHILGKYTIEKSKHTMCFAKVLGDSSLKEVLHTCFVWGLDSI